MCDLVGWFGVRLGLLYPLTPARSKRLSFFFFSGSHVDLHTPGDDTEKIEYDKAEKLSRLAYLITMELANMDQVPDFLE